MKHSDTGKGRKRKGNWHTEKRSWFIEELAERFDDGWPDSDAKQQHSKNDKGLHDPQQHNERLNGSIRPFNPHVRTEHGENDSKNFIRVWVQPETVTQKKEKSHMSKRTTERRKKGLDETWSKTRGSEWISRRSQSWWKAVISLGAARTDRLRVCVCVCGPEDTDKHGHGVETKKATETEEQRRKRTRHDRKGNVFDFLQIKLGSCP